MIFYSCSNTNFEFDDYEKQTVYFPYQYPVRVISMGDDHIDNSLDKESKFHIGVNVGGIWQTNDKDRHVTFKVDNSLVPTDNLTRNGSVVKPLPTEYYEIFPSNEVTISKGSLVGKIAIKLNDKFYADSMSLTGNYVIPLYIEDAKGVDEVIRGVGSDIVSNPNRHILTDWFPNKTPKDYTLFGVKYVNPYHGAYLRRALVETKSSSGVLIKSETIKQNSVDKDQVVKFYSSGKNQVESNYVGQLNADNNKRNIMKLIVDADMNIVISSTKDSQSQALKISGTGKWVKNGDSWGVQLDGTPTPRDVMYLDYRYIDGINTIHVKDTVVFRDRQIVFIDERPTVL